MYVKYFKMKTYNYLFKNTCILNLKTTNNKSTLAPFALRTTIYTFEIVIGIMYDEKKKEKKELIMSGITTKAMIVLDTKDTSVNRHGEFS